MRTRQIALTPEHLAQVHRTVEDPGPDPTWTYHADQDYKAIVQGLLASHPGGPDAWLFAYGSLIWKPELVHVEARRATARGWHRSFCFRIERFRGTKHKPGLMMSLDRGGQCRGVVFKLPPDDLESQLDKLVRREITVKPPNNIPRWVTVETDKGSLCAIAFVMNRQSRFYTGRLPPEEVADVLAEACGHWGSGAEYLHNTVAHLEEQGIRDRNLWRLQALVAERIRSNA
ncbi:cation transporter ChaC-like protein [Rhizobium gallicum bv. gallicum R602sp]|uniref:glutathione-specific gamma-glutamylcyclotransferase n=1 Tax=Rhizobium gallicum bv. gallicum R602sp TaxID=1041138 RepID=A0A0B4X1C6_9HYPH|nr:gamma-glutamylcyclotransferase [Rhizobium gallicum]AJD40971.1 cation transporter ChaC-like protein [Rhizobium gallicum bv. gallicum R602sp]TDW35041.1 cation transport protein ChaC [Rhizobium azibense]